MDDSTRDRVITVLKSVRVNCRNASPETLKIIHQEINKLMPLLVSECEYEQKIIALTNQVEPESKD